MTFILVLLLSFSTWAKPIFKYEADDWADKYLKLQREYSKKICSGAIEPTFWNKNREYNKNKYHLPVLLDGTLDRRVVRKYLPLIKEKSKWIKQNQNNVRKANFIKLRKEVSSLRRGLKQLLRYKQAYFDGKDNKRKEELIKKSKSYRIQYAKRLGAFIEKIPFLLSFHFPVNHLNFRKKYDSLKYLKTHEHKEKANDIYFYRKIVEDGAQNRKHRGNDIFLRSAIDTVFLGINKNIAFITEELRYDLHFILSKIDSHLRRGKKRQRIRLNEWYERVTRKHEYYKDLLREKVGEVALARKKTAHDRLKDFVLKKQAETYRFWSKQSEELQALFVIETILFNEVGGIDGRDALERHDISQVIINRRFMDEYNEIDRDDSIYAYLKKENLDHPWLNLLFKEGEFSFSYFFIPGTVRIFCPAMTKRARKLRRQNVGIAIKMLRNPNFSFKAVRYFSRASMLGRIDMSAIWKGFVSIPERPGNEIKSSWLGKRYRTGRYSYLYHFSDDKNYLYKVISVGPQNYVVDPETNHFHKYRNPHVFKYFSAIE